MQLDPTKKNYLFQKAHMKNNKTHQNPALNVFWKMCYEVRTKIGSRLYI